MRSVHIGCSRYSRRCRLLAALSFHRGMERGPGQGRSRRNSTFGYGACNRSVLNYAAASLRLRVLCSGSYASQLIQR